MADKIKTICRVNTEIKKGESPSHVFLRECNVTRKEAGRLGEWWAFDGFKKEEKYFDLDMWAKFMRQRSPALRQLPLAQVKEKILQKVAYKLGVERNQVPKNFMFIWVDPGTKVVANVIRGANGVVSTEAVSPEVSREGEMVIRERSGCFTGSTFLQFEDGRLVTFEQLAGWPANQSLPEVACFDSAKRKVIYQQPLAVLEHHYSEPQILSPICLGESLDELQVTPNHPLLAMREGVLVDEACGYLSAENHLVNPFGEVWSLTAPKKNLAAIDLYNLSLTTKENQTLSPYYLVSANGQSWVVAHNIKIYF